MHLAQLVGYLPLEVRALILVIYAVAALGAGAVALGRKHTGELECWFTIAALILGAVAVWAVCVVSYTGHGRVSARPASWDCPVSVKHIGDARC